MAVLDKLLMSEVFAMGLAIVAIMMTSDEASDSIKACETIALIVSIVAGVITIVVYGFVLIWS